MGACTDNAWAHIGTAKERQQWWGACFIAALQPPLIPTACAACLCLCVALQGLGTAVLAAILGSLPKTGGSLADHTVLLSGEAREGFKLYCVCWSSHPGSAQW